MPGAHLADVWFRGREQGVAFAFQKELRTPLKLQVNERRPTSSRRVWVRQLGSTTAGTRWMWLVAVPPMLNTESGAQWPPPTPRKKTKNSVLSHKTSSTTATGSCPFSPKSLHISAQVRLPLLWLQLGARSPGEHLRETPAENRAPAAKARGKGTTA